MNVSSRKLAHKRISPFSITQIISPNAVCLHLPKTLKIHDVINVSRLSPFIPPVLGQEPPPPPPPVIVEGQKEYEVEKVLNSRLRYGHLQYLVKWKGYTIEHNMWEPESNLTNFKTLIKDFHRQNPSAPRKMNAISMDNFLSFFKPIFSYTDITFPKFTTPEFHNRFISNLCMSETAS